MKIKGGYYIKARCVQDSEIAEAPPHVREIWDWLLKECNHSARKSSGKTIERGQCVRSYKDIQDGLKWKVGWRTVRYSKNDCETSMRWLKNHTMVHTKKTTRGMIITVLNYSKYQDPTNYEAYNEAYKKHTRSIQTPATINKNDKNEKNKESVQNQKKHTPIGNVFCSDSEFELFWQSYPKRANKKKAKDKFLKIKREDLKEILNAIEIQKQSKQWQNHQYIPHPETWLNNERWKDEVKGVDRAEEARELCKQHGSDRALFMFAAKYGNNEASKYDVELGLI